MVLEIKISVLIAFGNHIELFTFRHEMNLTELQNPYGLQLAVL